MLQSDYERFMEWRAGCFDPPEPEPPPDREWSGDFIEWAMEWLEWRLPSVLTVNEGVYDLPILRHLTQPKVCKSFK